MEDTYNYRFGGMLRLFGQAAADKLKGSHVAIVGIGGVGSWVAESLARSGVGYLTLIDFDEICVSNTNRQAHTLQSTVGQLKVNAMAERLKNIHPQITVHPISERFDADTAERLLKTKYNYIVDATDLIAQKCLLISRCRELSIPLVTTGSGGGRRDPTQIRINDLAFTHGDRLLQRTRKKLRQDHQFPRQRKKPFGIAAVYSLEPAHYLQADGCTTQNPEQRPSRPLDCATGLGTASFFTGAMGFAAAYRVVSDICAKVQP